MMETSYRYLDTPESRESIEAGIDGEGRRTFVAEIEGQVVGYLVANVRSDGTKRVGGVSDAYVLPQHRRKGVATRLYEAASQWFAASGCDSERLTVLASNPAMRLYEACGFRPFSIHMRKRGDAWDRS